LKKVLCFFNDFFIGLKRNVVFNLFLLVLIGISFFGGTKVKAYYSFNRNQSVSFTTATYTALSLTTDRSTYGMCNRDATVKLTINNPNIYNVNYTISINDSKLTYIVDGSSSSSYTITKNGTKTHEIVLKGTTTNTSVSIIVTPTGAYSSSHSKSINLDLVCPVCTWETPSVSKLMKDQTFTYNLTCTDASGIATSTLASTAFTVSNSNMISITGVTATKVTNGYKYGLTVKGGSTNGNATISVKAGSVADNNSNKNASVTSSNINVNNNVTVNFDHNYNILNENTSKWTFHGQSKVDSSNQYNGKTGVAVYSNENKYTGIKIPILSTNYHQNVTYLLSGRFKKGANFTGTLKYYTPAYDSSNTVVNWNVIGITASNLSSTWKLFQLKISSSTYSIPSLLLLYDTANQGPTYISDIKLREYATDTKQYKTAYGTLPTSTRVGYTFSGWYTGETDGTKVADTTTITNTNEHTLYGHWNANTYTINYYTYDGKTKLGSSTHTYDSAKALTTMATLKGTAPNGKVTFYGWATSANSTSRVYTDGQNVNNLTATSGGTINLYAIYRSAPVTITYKSGLKAATTSTSSTVYYYNAATSVSITTATPATINEWDAQGWRADTTAGAKTYSSNTATNFSASTTLYGVYAKSYTATFYSGVEKATTKTVQSSTSYYNSSQSALPTTVNVAVPSKADTATISNWDGLGYRTDTKAQAQAYAFGETKAVAFGTNFYAVYSRTLTVSYNGNGSTSGSTAATTKTVYLNTNSKTTSSQTVTLANNGFARTGYTYSKWAAGSENGTQYAAGASYTPNVAYNAVPFGITMYAVWTANQYTITYDQNYYSDNLWTDANNINRYYGTGLTSKTNVSESLAIGGEAMKFVMSATTSGGPYFANTAALTAGTTYTWEVYVKSNVSKNLSIGSEQGGRKTFSITTSWQRLTYTFTAEDKQYIAFGFFGNWSDGDELYVHSLQIREGNQPTTSSKLTYGTTLGDTVKTLSRTGYTFAGWYTSPIGGSRVTSTSAVPAADTTYYAHWTANTYTIGYTLNGGTKGTNGPTSGTFDSILTIDNPTKTFTVNITNSASGTLSATSVSKAQTFAGWTAANSTTGTAMYGTSNTAVKTAWNNGATKVTAKYFRSLRSTSGTVTLTANWKAVAVTLPTITKTGYTCGYTATNGGTTITYASGASYTPSTTTASATLYTVCTANTYTIGYTLNGGTKGTNGPTSGTYNSVLTIDNPSKTFTVNITNSASGTLSATSASKAQTFAGWTATNSTTGTAMYGTSSDAVSTAWSNGATKVTAKYFKNLRSTSGTVTLTANWTAVAVTLPTVTKTGYTCGYTATNGGTTITYASGASYTPSTTTASATLYTVCTANTYTIGYTLNGGTKGTNGPTSGTYNSVLTIDNPSKTFTVNITNSASGTLSATSESKAQTFAGWTATNSTTGTAMYGTSSDAVSTAWSNGATKVTAKYFKNLRSTSGTVTLTANWTAVAVTLPTITKTGYTCGYTATNGGTTITYASGSSYTPSTTTANVTLYTVCVDKTAPSPSISTTSNLKAASQTATLKCTDGVGVTSYYWGTKASPAASDYTTITSTTSMSVNKTVSAAGTYYLICKDAAGNASSSTNKTYRSYTVNNMLLNIKGSKGTYTTANYTSASTKTYIIPNSTAITLTSIYTAPTGGTYVGTSSGAASNDSATLLTSNPTITANTTYTAWFNRNEYTITVATGGNGSVKVTSENNTTGVTATASGSNKTLTARYGEKISATATPNSGFKFSSWSSGFSGSTNPASLTVSASVTIKGSFADNSAPTCSFGSFSPAAIMKDSTATITLTCTDNIGVVTNVLTSSSFTVSNSNMISIEGVTATKVTNGYKYSLTVKGGSTNGNATISIKAGMVADNSGNTNASVTSPNININNNVTVNFDHNYNIYDENTSNWTFQGQSKVDSSNQYNGKPGFAVYSNAYQYTGIIIPILSTKVKQNTSYLLSAQGKLGATISGNLRLYAPTFNSDGTKISSNYGINWNTSNTTTSAWKYFGYKFNLGASDYFSNIGLNYDVVNQGPIYISDLKLREYTTDTKQYKTAYGTLPTPTRTGYRFNGWYTSETGGTVVNNTTIVSNSNTHTLYAHWSDVEAPTCSFGSFSPTSTMKGSTATITLTCTDNVGVVTNTLTSSSFTISNTSAISISSITSSAVSGGYQYVLTIIGGDSNASSTISLNAGSVKDAAGNSNATVTSASITNVADQSGPEISFSPNGNMTYSKSQSTKVTVTDMSNVASAKYLWTQTKGASASNGTAFTSGATITKNSGDGLWYLCVYATDSYGNATNECSEAFALDNTPPVITASDICILKGQTLTISNYATASDANGVTLSASSLDTSTTGVKSVTITATDGAGNTSTKTVKVYVYTKLTETLVTSGDGLYKDAYTVNRYLYRGSSPNNYLTFNGQTWRIVAVNPDGTYKLVYMTSLGNRQVHSANSTFAGTRLETYLLDTYYAGLTTEAKNYIVSSGYYYEGKIGSTNYNDTMATNVNTDRASAYTGKVALLSASDLILASTHSKCTNYYYSYTSSGGVIPCFSENYLSALNSSDWWIMNNHTNGNSRYFNSSGLQNKISYDESAVYPSVTIKGTTTFLGSGTSSDPYTICTNCEESGLSSTTCEVTTSDGYDTSKVITITPSSTSGITYSWDGINWSSTNSKTITEAGVYSAWIKDSSNKVNRCSVTINSRKEYRKASCSTNFGSWHANGGKYVDQGASCGTTKAEAESWGGTQYFLATTGAEWCTLPSGGAGYCTWCQKFTRTCTPTNCSEYGAWQTEALYGSCNSKVESRTAIGK